MFTYYVLQRFVISFGGGGQGDRVKQGFDWSLCTKEHLGLPRVTNGENKTNPSEQKLVFSQILTVNGTRISSLSNISVDSFIIVNKVIKLSSIKLSSALSQIIYFRIITINLTCKHASLVMQFSVVLQQLCHSI